MINMSKETLAFMFATIASLISIVSLYYVRSHVRKLKEVEWK